MCDYTWDQATGPLVDPCPQKSTPKHTDEPDKTVAMCEGKDTGADDRGGKECEPSSKRGIQQSAKRQFLKDRGEEDVFQ